MTFLKSSVGQSMTEYTLIGALVALLAVGALGILGGSISDSMNGILGSGKQKSPASTMALSGPESLSGLQASSSNTSANSSSQLPQSEADDVSNEGNAQTVVTTGTNGTLASFRNNISGLKEFYEEQDDPEFRALLAQLLLSRFLTRYEKLNATGGPPVVDYIEQTTYSLGDVSVISQGALPGLNGAITEIQGSPEFAELSPSDQQKLTQLMQELQTDAEYFVNADNQ